MAITAKRIIVKGEVQGVFFRKYTEEKASALKLKGWVQNTDDGEVEIFVQGEDDTIKKLVDWCWKGSPKAEVTNVEVQEAGVEESLTDFSVRR